MFDHLGITVADLERSRRFYGEVLGLRPWHEIQPPDAAVAKLSGLEPPLATTAAYLVLGDFVLELIHDAAPGATAPAREPARSLNEPGLTHLTFAVADVAATVARAIAHGGQQASAVPGAVFIRDPDGQLLLLHPEAPEAADGRPPRPR